MADMSNQEVIIPKKVGDNVNITESTNVRDTRSTKDSTKDGFRHCKNSKKKPSKQTSRHTADSSDKTATPSVDSNPVSQLAAMDAKITKLMDLVPIVAEMKKAYDAFPSEDEESQGGEDQDNDSVCEGQDSSKDDQTMDAEEGEILELEEFSYFQSITETEKKVSSDIMPEMAIGVTKILSAGLTAPAKESILKKYVRPDNCPRMDIIQPNEEIIANANKVTKTNDLACCNMQKVIMKGLMASLECFKVVQKLKGQVPRDELQPVITTLTDAISLQADSSHSLDVYRRAAFKDAVYEDYASLCTSAYPVEGLLFGTQLSEKIKTVGDSALLTKKVGKKPYLKKDVKKTHKKSSFFGGRGPYRQQGNRPQQGQSSQSNWKHQNTAKKTPTKGLNRKKFYPRK